MTEAVVDASVALSWVLPDERCPLANDVFERHMQGELDLIAPTLWQYEVVNGLRRAVVQGRIGRAEGNRSLQTLLGMELQLASFEDLAARAWEVSFARSLTVYDASYVALAEARECDLYTCDVELAGAVTDVVSVRLIRAE
ncbi:MAG: type II toxin-antitoxin system VapC family toxin [Armatimonadota bacterium]